MDIDLKIGPPLHQSPGSSGVIKMNVRQQHSPRLLIPNRVNHRRERRLGPRINQRPINLPTTNDMGAPQVHDVNNPHPRQPMGVGGGSTGPSPLLSGRPSPDYLKR